MAPKNKNNYFDELKILYEHVVGEMRFGKLQMWRTMYLTIISIAAVFGLYTQINRCQPLFILLIILLCFAGGFLIKIHNDRINENRYNLNEICRELFGDIIKRDEKKETKLIELSTLNKPHKVSDFNSNELFFWVFIATIVAALILSIIGLCYFRG